jgi:hypothetical protein
MEYYAEAILERSNLTWDSEVQRHLILCTESVYWELRDKDKDKVRYENKTEKQNRT